MSGMESAFIERPLDQWIRMFDFQKLSLQKDENNKDVNVSPDEWAYLEGQILNRRYIRQGLGVANIEEKVKENCLTWFRHVQDEVLASRQRRQKVGTHETQKRARKTKDDLEDMSKKEYEEFKLTNSDGRKLE